MEQSLEVTKIKTEPTDSISSDQGKISYEMQLIKQKSDCLVQSKIDIKTEPQEYESEFPVIAGTSLEMCPNYDIKFETEEPLIKLECEDPLGELIKDPLDIGSEIKDEKHFPVNLVQSGPMIKTEPTDKEKDVNISETDKDDSHGGQLNQGQDQLSIRSDSVRKDKKYVCKECHKTFTQKSNLDQHLRIHTGEKPFTCVVCEKLFNLKCTLTRHMRVHSGEKPHICDVCKKVFSQKSSLNSHKLIHNAEKPFSCNQCGKSFKHKTYLVVHKQIHAGNKPFACDLCDKAFTQKPHFTEHRRLHTGEKPYCCDICDKSFAQKKGLNTHKRAHTH